jgi:hypothetical protein
MICDGQARIEAMWLRECLQALRICRVEDLDPAGSFDGGHLVAFQDGSVLFRHYVRVTESYLQAVDEFYTKDFISNITSYEGSLLFNKSLTITFAHPTPGSKKTFELNWVALNDLRQFMAAARRGLGLRPATE